MLRFIFADLRRLWAGALVMVVLIALGVSLGVAVTLEERALRLGSARASEKFDLVIGAPGSETQLVLSTVFLQPAVLPLVSGDVLADLQRDSRVAWAAPAGFGDTFHGLPLIGTTTRLVEEVAPGLAEGRLFATEGEAVIGAKTGLALGQEITPTHGDVAHSSQLHSGVSYRVTGRLNPTGTSWDRAILVPIQSVWTVHGVYHGHDAGQADEADHGADHPGHHHAAGSVRFDSDRPLNEVFVRGETPDLPAILVKPASIADAYKLRQEYRSKESTLAVFPGEVLTHLYGLLGNISQVLMVVAIGAQALVAAALLVVTVIHIGQRRRQIGALRAFGAPRSAIFKLVWCEMLLLVGSGTALGYAGGYMAATMMSRMVAQAQGFNLPVFFTVDDLWALALLLATAAFLATLPALMAYRQSPAAALRG